MSATVTCPKCKWVFPAQSAWAYLQTKQRARKHCPRCWTEGPFPEATDQEVAIHEAKQSEGWQIAIVFELIFLAVIVVIAIAHR
jgi:hypothetical protein